MEVLIQWWNMLYQASVQATHAAAVLYVWATAWSIAGIVIGWQLLKKGSKLLRAKYSSDNDEIAVPLAVIGFIILASSIISFFYFTTQLYWNLQVPEYMALERVRGLILGGR